jgi:hypothetical protein
MQKSISMTFGFPGVRLLVFRVAGLGLPLLFRCLCLDKDTCDGSGWETEYAWGTCVEWNPKYLNHWSCLAQVDGIKAVKFLIHEMWLSSNTLLHNVSWDVFEKFEVQTWSTPRKSQALNDIKVVRIDLNPKPYTLHPIPYTLNPKP